MEQKLPKALRSARVLMYVQGGLSLVGTLLLVALLAEEDGAGLFIALSVLDLALAMTILVAAAMLHRRPPWVRPTVLTVEGIVIAFGAINLLMGLSSGTFTPTMLFPILFGVLVIQALSRPEAKNWFADGVTA